MTTKKLVLIALVSAIAFFLSEIKVFQMPQGGSITLYLVPLLLAAFNDDLKTCLIIGFTTAILQAVFGGFTQNIIQAGLDYFLPVIIITICSIFKINDIVNFLIASIIALASYTVSGMVFYETPFIASLIYNATFFIPTIIVNLIIVLIINQQISKVYPK